MDGEAYIREKINARPDMRFVSCTIESPDLGDGLCFCVHAEIHCRLVNFPIALDHTGSPGESLQEVIDKSLVPVLS